MNPIELITETTPEEQQELDYLRFIEPTYVTFEEPEALTKKDSVDPSDVPDLIVKKNSPSSPKG